MTNQPLTPQQSRAAMQPMLDRIAFHIAELKRQPVTLNPDIRRLFLVKVSEIQKAKVTA